MRQISKVIKGSLFAAALGVFASSASADVILHAFDWHYNKVTDTADAIQAAGYKAVLVVPPLKSSKDNCQWWARYQPQDFRVIDHCRGNKEDFAKMIKALGDRQIAVYADVVVNQMANERNNSTTFPGDASVQSYKSNPGYWNNQKLFGDLNYGLFSSWDFHAPFCISNWTDTYQSVHGRICGQYPDPGLPDLKDTEPGNNYVNDRRTDYLRALKQMGVKGFRIDAAKHMPYGAISYTFKPDISDGAFIFSEIITAGGVGNKDYDTFLGPYLSQTPAQFRAYDFPLLNTIKAAFSPGSSLSALVNPKSTGSALDGTRAVTMVVTHDIPYNDGFRHLILDQTDEKLAYAYLLGRQDGVPMILDDGTDTRTDYGRWVGQFNAPHIVAGVKFHERVLAQSYEVLASNDCALIFRRGKEGIVGINKCGSNASFDVNTNERFYWFRNYRDAIGKTNIVNINSSTYRFVIPGRTALMWLPE